MEFMIRFGYYSLKKLRTEINMPVLESTNVGC